METIVNIDSIDFISNIYEPHFIRDIPTKIITKEDGNIDIVKDNRQYVIGE